ncbi:MAG: arginase [Planctomycetota bacterium]|nr:MAG: arginase [Planctomycetota bacterium]
MANVEAPGGDGLFGLDVPPHEAGVVVLPVPFEATVSYRAGTAQGPAAILAASQQLDLFDLETGEPWRAGIAMLPAHPRLGDWNARARSRAVEVLAAGGVDAAPALADVAAEVDALCARVHEWVRQEVGRELEAGRLVAVVGGDHSVAYGSIAAHAERCPDLGVLHVDAHADLRRAYAGLRWSHASIFHNVLEDLDVAALVGVGYRDLAASEQRRIAEDPRITALSGPELWARLHDGEAFRALADEVVSRLPESVYVSFDVDGLEPALCPHTGTPVPGGLTFAQATGLLAAVVRSGRRIVGFDLCEVAPGPDGDEWDGNVGARLLYKLVGFALKSR